MRPHLFKHMCLQCSQESGERERSPVDNEWPALYHRCITVWCGTEQWHSSHSKKTPCWFISCLLNEPSLVRILKDLCLLGLNYALSPPVSQRSDLNLQILVPTCSLREYVGCTGQAQLCKMGRAALLSQQAWPAFSTPHPLAQAIQGGVAAAQWVSRNQIAADKDRQCSDLLHDTQHESVQHIYNIPKDTLNLLYKVFCKRRLM